MTAVRIRAASAATGQPVVTGRKATQGLFDGKGERMKIEVRGVAPLLWVFDMPRSVRFYRDALGFEVVRTSESGEHFDWALLRLGDAELMLNAAYDREERPPAPDPARTAGHADVTIFFGCPDVDGAYALLRARGVDAKPPVVRPYGMKQLTVCDPDGFQLCFQWTAG